MSQQSHASEDETEGILKVLCKSPFQQDVAIPAETRTGSRLHIVLHTEGEYIYISLLDQTLLVTLSVAAFAAVAKWRLFSFLSWCGFFRSKKKGSEFSRLNAEMPLFGTKRKIFFLKARVRGSKAWGL